MVAAWLQQKVIQLSLGWCIEDILLGGGGGGGGGGGRGGG